MGYVNFNYCVGSVDRDDCVGYANTDKCGCTCKLDSEKNSAYMNLRFVFD